MSKKLSFASETGLIDAFISPASRGIPPTCNMPLMIVSTSSPEGYLNMVQVSYAHPRVGQQITLYSAPVSQNPWNVVWQLTPQGRIVVGQYPQLVIGIEDNVPVLCTLNESDASQQWTLIPATTGSGYLLINQASQYNQAVLTAPVSQVYYDGSYNTQSSGDLSLSAQIDGEAGQIWTFRLAEKVPPNRFYIQTSVAGAPGTGAIPYVVANANGSAFVQKWIPGDSSQLWEIHQNGTILSLADGQVLTADANNTNGGNVTIAPLTEPVADNQTWVWPSNSSEPPYYISIAGNSSLGLNIPQTNLNSQLITYYLNHVDNSLWYVFPEQSLLIEEWFYLETAYTDNSNDTATYVLTNSNSSIGLQQIQPGNLNQLWKMQSNGQIINAATIGTGSTPLMLTSGTGNREPVTLNNPGSGNPLQSWCFCPNGTLVVTTGDEMLYLQATSLPDGNNNGGVQVATNTNGSSVQWKPVPYEPDLSGQWFTINSGLTDPGTDPAYLLTLEGNWSDINLYAPLGGNVLPQGQASVNQLWRRTLDGYILNALNPNLVLTNLALTNSELNNKLTGLIMAPIQSGNSGQIWEWGETTDWQLSGSPKLKNGKVAEYTGGIIQNPGKNQVLWADDLPAAGTYSVPSVTVNQQQTPANTANQTWYLLPTNPVYDQFTTIRNLGGTSEVQDLFLSLKVDIVSNAYNSSSIGIGQQGVANTGTTWKFVYPGYIVNSINLEIVLSVQMEIDTDSRELVYGPAVVPYLRQPTLLPIQLWTLTEEGMLINQQTGWALSVTDEGSGIYTITTSQTGSDPVAGFQIWEFSPGQALQTILVQPPIHFPTLSGTYNSGQSCYDAINKYLGLKSGLRSQYMNLAAPLGSYQTEMNNYVMQQTGGSPVGGWLDTITQLNKELTRVIGVQLFFQQAQAFHSALTVAQTMQLQEMITACAFPPGQTVNPQKKNKVWIADLIQGIVYTGLNIVGFPVLANLITTTFSAAQAGLQARKQGLHTNQILQHIYSYEMTVEQLQVSLLDAFENSGTVLGEIETLILNDWGKISAVYDMIQSVGGIYSLYWPPMTTPVLAKQLLSAYGIGLLQILIPSNTSNLIYGYLHILSGAVGLQDNQITYGEMNLDGSKNQWNANINLDVMNLVWANGTSPADFFNLQNGWEIPMVYQNLMEMQKPAGVDGNASVVVTVKNHTPEQLSVVISDITGIAGSGENLNLPPFGLTEFAGFAWSATPNSTLTEYTAYGPFSVQNAAGNNILTGYLESNAETYGVPVGTQATYSISQLTAVKYYKAESVLTSSTSVYFITLHIYADGYAYMKSV